MQLTSPEQPSFVQFYTHVAAGQAFWTGSAGLLACDNLIVDGGRVLYPPAAACSGLGGDFGGQAGDEQLE